MNDLTRLLDSPANTPVTDRSAARNPLPPRAFDQWLDRAHGSETRRAPWPAPADKAASSSGPSTRRADQVERDQPAGQRPGGAVRPGTGDDPVSGTEGASGLTGHPKGPPANTALTTADHSGSHLLIAPPDGRMDGADLAVGQPAAGEPDLPVVPATGSAQTEHGAETPEGRPSHGGSTTHQTAHGNTTGHVPSSPRVPGASDTAIVPATVVIHGESAGANAGLDDSATDLVRRSPNIDAATQPSANSSTLLSSQKVFISHTAPGSNREAATAANTGDASAGAASISELTTAAALGTEHVDGAGDGLTGDRRANPLTATGGPTPRALTLQRSDTAEASGRAATTSRATHVVDTVAPTDPGAGDTDPTNDTLSLDAPRAERTDHATNARHDSGLADRVQRIAEHLRHAPPPRQVTITLADGRVRVGMIADRITLEFLDGTQQARTLLDDASRLLQQRGMNTVLVSHDELSADVHDGEHRQQAGEDKARDEAAPSTRPGPARPDPAGVSATLNGAGDRRTRDEGALHL